MRRPLPLSRLSPWALSSMALAVLAACSSVPSSNPSLDHAVASLHEARADPGIRELAAAELQQADAAVARARAAQASSGDAGEVDHLAYLARQRVYVAQEVAGRRRAEREIARATAEREQVRLEARTRQADQAERRADSADRQAEVAARSAAESQRLAQASALQTAAADRLAGAAREQTRDAQARADGLAQLLVELDARQTQRGMVITISDMLFDTSRSGLKADGQRNLDRLVSLLRQHPGRRVLIEGYTDSVGSDDSNRALSDRRANTVRAALIEQGIGSERLAAHGFGERHPVASNDSADGRQLNRRVEIVLSDESGRVTPR
jgi:outer membrane protein OmpA-like peptidoglycan-associated protein